MSKGEERKKEAKKQPAKTMLEKRAAMSAEQTTAAAAPSEIDEHISSVSGSTITRDCTTIFDGQRPAVLRQRIEQAVVGVLHRGLGEIGGGPAVFRHARLAR